MTHEVRPDPSARPACLARLRCHAHFIRRSRQRGLGYAPSDLARLDALFARTRDLPGSEGRRRVRIAVRRGRERLVFIFEVRLGCVITVWRR